MSGTLWQPLHEGHSIQEMVFSLEFDRSLDSTVFQKLINGNSPFDGLPDRSIDTAIRIILARGPQPSPLRPPLEGASSLPGLNFDRRSTTDTVAERLLLRDTELAYVTTEYSRWAPVATAALRHFSVAAGLQPDRLLQTGTLRYIDKFVVTTGSDPNPKITTLVDQGSPLLAERAVDTMDTCHSHCGFWRQLPSGGKALINLNLDVVDEVDAGRVAVILTSVRQTYEANDCYRLDTDGLARLRKTMDEAHAICNEMIGGLLTMHMKERIGLSIP